MEYEYFSEIVETCNIEEVNKLCSEGWLCLGKVENKNRAENETVFIYSFGKKPTLAF